MAATTIRPGIRATVRAATATAATSTQVGHGRASSAVNTSSSDSATFWLTGMARQGLSHAASSRPLILNGGGLLGVLGSLAPACHTSEAVEHDP